MWGLIEAGVWGKCQTYPRVKVWGLLKRTVRTFYWFSTIKYRILVNYEAFIFKGLLRNLNEKIGGTWAWGNLAETGVDKIKLYVTRVEIFALSINWKSCLWNFLKEKKSPWEEKRSCLKVLGLDFRHDPTTL